jgi:hypothetical protein
MNTHAMPLHPRDAVRQQALRIETARACRGLLTQHGTRSEGIECIDGYIRQLEAHHTQLQRAERAFAADED